MQRMQPQHRPRIHRPRSSPSARTVRWTQRLKLLQIKLRRTNLIPLDRLNLRRFTRHMWIFVCLLWLITLVSIRVAILDILSPGREVLPPPRALATTQQGDRSLLEFITAMGIGCIGLSLLLAPALRRSSRSRR